MQQFTYVGDPGRYYPDLGVTGVPGEPVEFETAPADGRWEDADGHLVVPSESPAEAATPVVIDTEHDIAPPAEGEPATTTTEDTTLGGK